MNTAIIEIDGLKIEYSDSKGKGPWVFLFHGNSSSLEVYSELFNSELGNSCRLIAVNFPGHGKSSLPCLADKISIPELGRFTVDVINHFNARNYIIIGQSVGGHALLESLNQHNNAQGLMLISAPPLEISTLEQAFLTDPTEGLIFQEQLNEAEITIFSSSFLYKVNSNKMNRLRKHIKNTDGRFRNWLGQSIKRGEIIDEFSQLNQSNIPVAMISSSEDKFINPDYYKTLNNERFWKGSVLELEGVGHASMIEDNGILLNIITEFINYTFEKKQLEY